MNARNLTIYLLLVAVIVVGGCDEESPKVGFEEIEEQLFENPAGGLEIDGLVVRHRDEIVFEQYANGFDSEMPHHLWSVSKPITATLVGIAVEDGMLSVDDSVCDHMTAPAGSDPDFCEITIEHLLHMTAGLEWNESYGVEPMCGATSMLFGDNDNMAEYYATQSKEDTVGTSHIYSTGATALLARVVQLAVGTSDLGQYAQDKLFAPSGIESAVIERDRSGSVVGGAGMYMTARDLSRFGQLYLNRGRADDAQVISSSWVDYVRQPGPDPFYGAHWSLIPDEYISPNQDLLRGMIYHDGFLGQAVVVAPDAELVVAVMSNNRQGLLNIGKLVSMILSALELAPDDLAQPLYIRIGTLTGNTEQYDLPVSMAGWAAQVGCSCLFVVGQSEDYCRGYAELPIDFGLAADVAFDATAKSVRAVVQSDADQFERTARWTDGAGCTLDVVENRSL